MENAVYMWYKYNLNVICDKCNHAIPFQSFTGNPHCEECGTTSDKTWTDAVIFSGVKKVKQYKDGSTSLGGFMQLQMNYEAVDNIACFNCHHTLENLEDSLSNNIECSQCHQKIECTIINEDDLKDLVFYFHKNKKSNPQGNIIAVRCASCGAPLQADNTKNEYTCNFCSTLNIIPPVLRAKKVLDDVYVGWNGKL